MKGVGDIAGDGAPSDGGGPPHRQKLEGGLDPPDPEHQEKGGMQKKEISSNPCWGKSDGVFEVFDAKMIYINLPSLSPSLPPPRGGGFGDPPLIDTQCLLNPQGQVVSPPREIKCFSPGYYPWGVFLA